MIADLSLHHLAGPFLRAGYTIAGTSFDYGVDAYINTFSPNGEIEIGTIFAQLKATDHIERYRLQNGRLSFPFKAGDLDYWISEPYPVFLVLYDARAEIAFWLDIQEYLQAEPDRVPTTGTMNVHFDAARTVDDATPRAWRDRLRQTLQRL